MRPSREAWTLQRARDGRLGPEEADALAAEEPLEIRLNGRSLVVTMRTPGDDEDLALGFVVNEGLVAPDARPQVVALDNPLDAARGNLVNVRVPSDALRRAPSERAFRATSACGVCGLSSLEEMARDHPPVDAPLRLRPDLLGALPARMRDAQRLFDETGGLHAAALFDAEGTLLCLREDVGRHNALDKATGWAMRERRLPLSACALLVSGRAGYEIVQKAVASGIPLVAAVGAPSTLAARLAQQANVTLVGFLKPDSFNVYTHAWRLSP